VAEAPSVARIEATSGTQATQPVPTQPRAVAATVAEPAVAPQPAAATDAAQAQPETIAKIPSKTSTKIATAPKHTPVRTQAPAYAATTDPSVRTRAKAATAVPATGESSSVTANNASPNKDADIALLSALLAHVSSDGPVRPLGAQTQLTIAQIVQRCEARDGKDSKEARDCRRRICDGYWGKAQACPARLAPKKS
jgi:hypothetical protein